MIAVDANLLVYAHRADSAWHAPARERLRELAEGSDPWAIPWPCLHEFVAIATHPRIYAPPTPTTAAIEQVDCWLESPVVALIGESDRHWRTLRGLLAGAKAAGPLVHDARIAAICIDHGVRVLWSADRDFSRFSGLRVVNPLVGGG
jgi:toxin-antitoxin system PIN domain toxin